MKFLNTWKNDLPASIVVFLVAVPLCLGIALASGAPLFSGIIAGIVGGVVVGSLSGSQLGVSGPAAGLTVIVLAAINDLGAFNIFLLAVVVAGIMQLALGFLRAGIIGYYFPTSVIKGMLSGIGIIIVLKQIPHAFGYDADYEGDLAFMQPDGQNTFSELYHMLGYISPGAVIISVLALATLILWERPFMKKIKAFQIIQGPLVVVIMGIILNFVFDGIPALQLKSSQIVSIPVAESLSGFFDQFTFPDFSHFGNPEIYITAITLAVVASLETLLCVEATDKLDPQKRVTPTNRELKAQGVGNIVSGLIGGLPVTQVIVRSSANIQSGGKTKASAIIHGFMLLLCAMLIPNILNMIPLASLAAILFMVGYKLAKPELFKQMYKLGKRQFLPFIVTIVAIIFTDLLIGITLGFVVALFTILFDNFRKPYFFDPNEHHQGDKIKIELAEDVTFLHKASMLQTLKNIPNKTKVTIDATKTVNIDYDVLEIINDFKESAQYREIEVKIKGLEDKIQVKNPVKELSKSVIQNQKKWKKKGKPESEIEEDEVIEEKAE